MHDIEKNDLFDKTIRQLWPKWDWKEAQISLWYRVLSYYPFERSRQSLNRIFEDGLMYKRGQEQLLPVFKHQMRLTTPEEDKKPKRQYPEPLFWLQCVDNPADKTAFFNDPPNGPNPTDDMIMRLAENQRVLCSQAYGRQYEIIRNIKESFNG